MTATHPHPRPVGIRVENLTVHLPIFNIHSLSLKKQILNLGSGGRIQSHARTVFIEALRDLSFEFKDGDRIGLVGLNGAGKSTLLRVLAGVYHPTAGSIDVSGRVVPMLATGVGMYDDATGYENIRNCGLQMGMSMGEIDEKAESIAEFTQLNDYMNLPIFTYSTGMRTRLSFAIATAMDSEILLLDEIIGAGDISFMHKAHERFIQMIERTRILVLASHNNAWVHDFCNKALLLDQGRLVAFGPTDEVLDTYCNNANA